MLDDVDTYKRSLRGYPEPWGRPWRWQPAVRPRMVTRNRQTTSARLADLQWLSLYDMV